MKIANNIIKDHLKNVYEPNSSLFSIFWENIMEPKLCYIQRRIFKTIRLFLLQIFGRG